MEIAIVVVLKKARAPWQETMTDPVILCETRLSYQRRHIEAWIITHGYNQFYKRLRV
jgi:hypothetical protein